MGKYTIGVDFGTLSCRGILLNIQTGAVAASCTYPYPIDLPKEMEVPKEAALHDPKDYVEGLIHTVRGVMEKAGVMPQEVVGLALDATASTILPVYKDKTPLCQTEEFRLEPQAYIKLWKHHGAGAEAQEIEEKAKERKEPFLSSYSGKVSAEFALPKILETLRKAPLVYQKADYFLEVVDYLSFLLTDEVTTSVCSAGYKAFYHPEKGYPSKEFYRSLDPRLEELEEKLAPRVLPVGEKAGGLTSAMAKVLGLNEGTPVGVSMVDAHAAALGSGVLHTGDLFIVMGTSSCHLMLADHEAKVQGIQGMVYGGILPGLYGIEAGQSGVGDLFDYWIKTFVPESYLQEAQKKQQDLHTYLCSLLEGYRAGSSGLLALDWFSGVRSPYMDFNLSGMLLGLTLHTKPEEVYLALMEATAFGTRVILEAFEKAGVPVKRILLGGGIPVKNPFLVQLYANVLGRQVQVVQSPYASALGSAMLGVMAAGKEVSGYETLAEVVSHLAPKDPVGYLPQKDQQVRYEALYQEYQTLSNYFSQENLVMHRLKER